jgi:hypothetical protein
MIDDSRAREGMGFDGVDGVVRGRNGDQEEECIEWLKANTTWT